MATEKSTHDLGQENAAYKSAHEDDVKVQIKGNEEADAQEKTSRGLWCRVGIAAIVVALAVGVIVMIVCLTGNCGNDSGNGKHGMSPNHTNHSSTLQSINYIKS